MDDNTESLVGKGILSHLKSFMHSDDLYKKFCDFGLANDVVKSIR